MTATTRLWPHCGQRRGTHNETFHFVQSTFFHTEQSYGHKDVGSEINIGGPYKNITNKQKGIQLTHLVPTGCLSRGKLAIIINTILMPHYNSLGHSDGICHRIEVNTGSSVNKSIYSTVMYTSILIISRQHAFDICTFEITTTSPRG